MADSGAHPPVCWFLVLAARGEVIGARACLPCKSTGQAVLQRVAGSIWYELSLRMCTCSVCMFVGRRPLPHNGFSLCHCEVEDGRGGKLCGVRPVFCTHRSSLHGSPPVDAVRRRVAERSGGNGEDCRPCQPMRSPGERGHVVPTRPVLG